MYLDGLSFLEDERDAWRPYEALDGLTDEQLERPVAAAHGWSGRDLMAHVLGWQEEALAAARELAVSDASPAFERIDAIDWDGGAGDAVNDEMLARFRAMPLDEVRRRFRETPGELRGYLTVVPETRWVKNAHHLANFLGETLEHYGDHTADLAEILTAVR